MSLVSARNLVAPLTNTVHLITILLIAITFAILRLSGASISISSGNAAPKQAQAPIAQDEIGSQLLQHRNPQQPWANQAAPKQQQQQQAAPQQRKGGLDDIEKALGL